ncbi:MAG TPA: YetF domain-containing protein [Chryseosolibacter sp.]
MSVRNQKFEAVTHGKVDTLVKEGVLDYKAMMKSRISRERILAELRSQQVFHLGEVKRLFFEANGSFTLVKPVKAKPGLAVIPESDPEFLQELKPNGQLVCRECGNLNNTNDPTRICGICHHTHWVAALETGVNKSQ